MSTMELDRDRQELDAINEALPLMIAAYERCQSKGDPRAAMGYRKRIDDYRRRSNVLAERLWPASVRYMDGETR